MHSPLRKKKLAILSAGGSAPTVPFGGLVSVDSLISYWKLKEVSGTRSDSHGTNHLSPTNNPVGSSEGCDFEYDSGQYLSCPSNPSLQLGDIAFTFAVWIKLESLPAQDTMLLSKDADTGREYTFTVNGSQFGITTFSTAPVAVSVSLILDTWYFVTAWRDSALGSLNLQVNNDAVATTTGGPPFTGDTEFRIGARAYPGFPGYIDGIIKEVGFWKRVLTPAEKTALWNGGTSITY